VSASVSALEALRSRRYAKPQPGMAARRAQCCSDVTPVLTVILCVTAMLLLIVPLLTIEADARGGGAGGAGTEEALGGVVGALRGTADLREAWVGDWALPPAAELWASVVLAPLV
jgi:hypothetical protein